MSTGWWYCFDIVNRYLNDESSEDLKTKSKRALKSVIAKCVMLHSLEPSFSVLL